MSKQKNIAGKHSYTKVYMVIALVLLTAFAGKILASGIGVYTSIQKNAQNPAAQSHENEDCSEKEDGKFNEKELNACILTFYLPITTVSTKADSISYHKFMSRYVNMHFLSVLTPPPNC